jgi:hypothetical protein
LLDIHSVYAPFLKYFRSKRMKEFSKLLKLNSATRIIDIGGSPYNWTLIPEKPSVTMINIEGDPWEKGRFRMEIGDGRALRFKDASFDIAYSNSVIEHVGSWENQRRFAEEVRRIAPRYYVQTPYRWFFVEPHLITPFVHFLPKAIQRRLLRNFTIHGLITRPDRDFIDRFVAETRLLTVTEMKRLFPDAIILRERFLWMTKSIIALRL